MPIGIMLAFGGWLPSGTDLRIPRCVALAIALGVRWLLVRGWMALRPSCGIAAHAGFRQRLSIDGDDPELRDLVERLRGMIRR